MITPGSCWVSGTYPEDMNIYVRVTGPANSDGGYPVDVIRFDGYQHLTLTLMYPGSPLFRNLRPLEEAEFMLALLAR